MDEPEAALSPQNQLALFYQINQMAKNGSQFIISTHSPILQSIPNSDIYDFDNNLKKCSCEDTGSYRLMKMFINNKEQLLKNLL